MVHEKIGLKGITRDGMDYEFTIVFDLDIKHHATASKDRTGLFQDKPEGIITPEYGKRILDWCNASIGVDEVKKLIQTATTIDELRAILKEYPEFRSQLEPLAIARKEELNKNLINATKIGGNGIDQSK
jgi:hypothetical protein